MFKMLRQTFSALTASALVLGMIAFVPNTLAALNLTFNKTPDSTFDLNAQDFITFQVILNESVENKTEVRFDIKPKDQSPFLVKTLNYQGDSANPYTWDGTFLGEEVPSGEYQAIFSVNNVNLLSHTFQVVNNDPTLTFSPKPNDEYTLGDISYKVSAALTNYKSDTLVRLGVREKGANNYFVVDEYDYQDNETRQFAWDGKLNGTLVDAGTYELLLSGTDDNNNPTNLLPHEVVVKESGIVDETLCAGYKDVNANNKYCDAVEWAKDENIMTGQDKGEYFDGASSLNRAEISKIALVAYNEYNANTDYCNGNKPFPDVELGQWFSNYICRAKDIGMVNGYEAGVNAGKFVPAGKVSVIEMFAILLRPLDKNFVSGPSYQGLATDQWYSEYAKYAKDNALYPGNVLSPTQEATRYEVVQFLYELHLDGEL